MPWTEVRDENVNSAVENVDMDSVINVIATCYLNTSESRAKANDSNVHIQNGSKPKNVALAAAQQGKSIRKTNEYYARICGTCIQ